MSDPTGDRDRDDSDQKGGRDQERETRRMAAALDPAAGDEPLRRCR
jgi:hypothetical protein